MKILYLITKSNWGGAQRHVFDLAVHSKKIGHEVVVALGGEGMLKDRLEKEGIRTHSISSMKRDIDVSAEFASFGTIFKIVRTEQPDVLHLHSPKAAGLGSLVGRLLRIPKIIFTVHGWTFNESRPIPQKASIVFISWLTMLFCTHVITLSEREMGQAQMFPFVTKKLRMIPLGIHSPIFMSKSSIDVFIKSHVPDFFEHKKEKPIIIGTIAELHPNKGLIYAINALEKVVERFPSLIFFVIGEGEQRPHLESLIKEKNLEKNVRLIGYVENAAQYLKAFSIFLISSIKEGLPYTLLEAGYAGLPVITTNVGGIPEIIDDMRSGILIQSKKSDEIAHALEFLLKHKNIQKEYGRNLQDKVRDTFNIERMLETTEKLYTSSTHQ